MRVARQLSSASYSLHSYSSVISLVFIISLVWNKVLLNQFKKTSPTYISHLSAIRVPETDLTKESFPSTGITCLYTIHLAFSPSSQLNLNYTQTNLSTGSEIYLGVDVARSQLALDSCQLQSCTSSEPEALRCTFNYLVCQSIS